MSAVRRIVGFMVGMAAAGGAILFALDGVGGAATPVTASLSGGAGTASVNGRVFARSGGAITLTVTTPTSARCVVLSGAHSGNQRSSVAKTTWTFPLTAPTGDVARSISVTAYAKVDNKGGCSKSIGSTSASYTSDNTAPTLTSSLSPAPNAAGWLREPGTVTWSATDGGSGVGALPSPASSVTSGDGDTVASSTVTDRVGNTRTGSRTVRVDTVAPVTTASVAGTTVSLAAADERSGVASTTYAVDGGSPVAYTAPFEVTGGGDHTVRWWSVDVAGNTEVAGTQSITVAPPPDRAHIEGETAFPQAVVVPDAAATGGTAVVMAGAATPRAGVPTGSYTLSLRVRSDRACVLTGMDLKLGGQFLVTGGAWQTITMPVHVAGPESTVALMVDWCYDKLGLSPLRLDWVSLVPSAPVFTTNGARVLTPSGKPYVARGVNRNGYELVPGGYWMSDFDYGHMKRWGSNFVRLQLSEVFWLSTSCQYDPLYAGRVDAAVQSITSRGMVALLDLHTNSKGTTCVTGTPTQQKMADAQSPEFWRQVAGRYKGNPRVAFDLYNEPHDITPEVWRNGGMVDGWRAVGMQELYDAVRSTGATNLVFVSGIGWAHHVAVALTHPIQGYGIVYAAHAYNGAACGPLSPNIDSNLTPVIGKYPVVITEFGTQCSTGDYIANVISYAEGHGIGWSAFAWNAAGPSGWSLLEAWNTHAPSAVGLPVWNELQRHLGETID